jgi:hypothetical protein
MSYWEKKELDLFKDTTAGFALGEMARGIEDLVLKALGELSLCRTPKGAESHEVKQFKKAVSSVEYIIVMMREDQFVYGSAINNLIAIGEKVEGIYDPDQ